MSRKLFLVSSILFIASIKVTLSAAELEISKWNHVTYKGKPEFKKENSQLLIASDNETNAGSWYCQVPVEPGKIYKLSAIIKTKGLKGKGARWYITFKGNDNKNINQSFSNHVSDPCPEGKLMEATAKAPPMAKTMIARLNLNLSSGEAAFSEMSCKEIEFSNKLKISGTVFEDKNGNGVQDADENGINGVEVSDGISVISSGASGNFEIERKLEWKKKKPVNVFVSIPSKYKPVSHEGWFKRFVNYDNKLENIKFPLQLRKNKSDNFSFVQISDTHVQSDKIDLESRSYIYKYTVGAKTWDYLFKYFIPGIRKYNPNTAFIMDTGDVGFRETAKNPIASAQRYRKKLNTEKIPVFFVPGNHDGLEVHEINPPYYSFNWGKFHFVSLYRYPLSKEEMNTQFEWLKKDLAFYPDNTPTIIFTHMHFGVERFNEKQPELYKLFDKHNVKALFFGHCHSLLLNWKKHNKVVQVSVPAANYGGGWCQEFSGFPPSYRIVKIKGDEIECSSVKSLECQDSPLWILAPKDQSVLSDTTMYPYFNSCNKWKGIVKAIFLDLGHEKINSMKYRIDNGEWLPMKAIEKGTNIYQRPWVSLKKLPADLSAGKHELTVKATNDSGKEFERSIVLYAEEKDLPTEKDLIPNASFEKVSTSDKEKPEAWNIGNNEGVEWDSSVKKNGKRSLKITLKPWKRIWLLDNIPVDPKKLYHLSYWVKGKDVLNMSYVIHPGFSDAHIVRLPKGTYDWEKVNVQFRIKPGLKKIGFLIANWYRKPLKPGQPYGTIWIDDIKLNAIKPEKKNSQGN